MVNRHADRTSRRVQPRPLHWDYPNDKFGESLKAVYSKLIKLRHEYDVLRGDGFYPDYWEEWQTRFNSVYVKLPILTGYLLCNSRA